MINLKSEKGGATVYVLITSLLLIVTLIAIYISSTNKHITQLEVAEQIKSVYEVNMNNIDGIYNQILNSK